MATPTLVASYKADGGSTTTPTSISVPSVQVGDWLVVVNSIDFVPSTVLVEPSGTGAPTGAGSYTQIGAVAGNNNPQNMRAWYKVASSTGTYTVTCSQSTNPDTGGSGNMVVVLHLRDCVDIDGTPTGTTGGVVASGGNFSLAATSPTTPNALLIAAWAGIEFTTGTITFTPPGTMIERQEQQHADVSALMVATQALTSSGSTGTRIATATPGTTGGGWAGKMFAISGPQADPIDPGAETGTGDETITVDKTDWKNLTDSGATIEALDVLVDWPALTESGTGDETLVVDQVTLIDLLAESGTGDDALEVVEFEANDLIETGTGDETIDVVRTTFVDLTDSGAGDDPIGLEFQWPLTDSGTGVETMVGLGTPSITDSGVGSEEIFIVDIPFTQVLPPSRLGNLYDLVVVARVVQQSGPPSFIEIDPIEWTDLTLTEELLNGQDLQASCQISSLSPTIIAALQDLGSQPVELWLYRNGRLVFAGPLRNGNTDNLRLTVTAKGAADYMRQMFVRADLVFKDVDQATIVKTMVDQHQATDFGHYGINTASITPTGVLREITYLKAELQNVAQKVQDLAKSADGFDFEVDPESRNLEIWFPGKGVDKSTGEDAVVFDSRNITSSSMAFSAGPDDIATEAFGTGTAVSGDGTSYGAVTNSELLARYGRSTIAGTWDGVPDQNTLNGLLQGMLNVRVTQLVVPGPDARDTPDSSITAYGVGDTVLYQPNELLTVASAYRIRKRSVKVTSAGQESVSLEFT